MIKVVHCKKEPYDIYIGRPSKWGNPFVIGKERTREQAVKQYLWYILHDEKLLYDISELKNKTIACWCSPELCHGHVLKVLVENEELLKKYLDNRTGPYYYGPFTSDGNYADELKEELFDLVLKEIE